MIKFCLSIKNGTGGYEDYDNCDLILEPSMFSEVLPRIGETIRCKIDNSYRVFWVKEVEHCFDKNNGVRIVLYCVPIDGKSVV